MTMALQAMVNEVDEQTAAQAATKLREWTVLPSWTQTSSNVDTAVLFGLIDHVVKYQESACTLETAYYIVVALGGGRLAMDHLPRPTDLSPEVDLAFKLLEASNPRAIQAAFNKFVTHLKTTTNLFDKTYPEVREAFNYVAQAANSFCFHTSEERKCGCGQRLLDPMRRSFVPAPTDAQTSWAIANSLTMDTAKDHLQIFFTYPTPTGDVCDQCGQRVECHNIVMDRLPKFLMLEVSTFKQGWETHLQNLGRDINFVYKHADGHSKDSAYARIKAMTLHDHFVGKGVSHDVAGLWINPNGPIIVKDSLGVPQLEEVPVGTRGSKARLVGMVTVG